MDSVHGEKGEKIMGWRDKPITDKQRAVIEDIMEYCSYNPPKFNGTTRGEASDYIDKWGKLTYNEDPNGFGFGY